jgi:hypothetical protein
MFGVRATSASFRGVVTFSLLDESLERHSASAAAFYQLTPDCFHNVPHFVATLVALAKRPAQEILFQWLRSARLVGELSDLMKRRHPAVQAEIDRVYKEHPSETRNPKDAFVVTRESEKERMGKL